MKKVLIISFLIFTILFSFFNTSYAAVAVTKENLSKAFESLVSSKANEDNCSFSVIDNVINITEDSETYALNYDLTDKPTFSFEIDIKKGISYEDFQNKYDNISLPMYGYIAVANIQGVKLEDAATYFLFSYLGSALGSASTNNGYIIYDDTSASEGVTLERDENSKTILVSEFGDRVMEYVNSLYPQTVTISDSEGINSFTMTIEKKDVTETSCKLVSTLSVNTDADFSNLNGTMDNFEDSLTGSTITEEDADYVVSLKVGQKFQVVANSELCGWSSKGDVIEDIRFSDYEFTAKSVGTGSLTVNVGTEQKLIFIKVEENPKNETLPTEVLKIEDNIPNRLSYDEITKETADYCIELKVGEGYDLNNPKFSNLMMLDNNVDIGFSSESFMITGLKPCISKGYIYEEVDEYRSTTKYLYVTVTEDSTISNTSTSNTTNTPSTSLQESVNKVTSSTNKLPQTGNFLNLQSLLLLLIVICSISLISNFKYKNIKIK